MKNVKMPTDKGSPEVPAVSTNRSDHREIPVDTNEKLSLLIESVASNACLPRLSDSEPMKLTDIEPYIDTVDKSMNILNVILEKFQRKQIKAVKNLDPTDRIAVLNLLLLCGEHQYINLTWEKEEAWVSALNLFVRSSCVWITPETHRLSEDLLTKLERMTAKTTPELINLYADICMDKLRRKAGDQTHWAEYPGVVHCYLWLLFHIESSRLVTLMEDLKCGPLITRILSHHSTENKMKALQGFLSVLRRLEDKDVCRVFDADKLLADMRQLFYSSHLELILPSTHCIAKIMQVKRNLRPRSTNALLVDYEWDLVDDLRDVIISFIETSSLDAKKTYLDAFSVLIAFSRLCALRWHYPIMQIIKQSIPERETHRSVLNMFEVYLLNIWPFIKSSCETYCSYLFKILLQCQDEEAKSRLYKCFYLIKTQCGGDNERLNSFLAHVRAQVNSECILSLINHEFGENEYDVDHVTLDGFI